MVAAPSMIGGHTAFGHTRCSDRALRQPPDQPCEEIIEIVKGCMRGERPAFGFRKPRYDPESWFQAHDCLDSGTQNLGSRHTSSWFETHVLLVPSTRRHWLSYAASASVSIFAPRVLANS